MQVKIGLFLLPVLEPTEPTGSNGFDAPAKKRKRSNTRTRGRCANQMTPQEFDTHCRKLAREEIVRAITIAEEA